MAQANRAQRRPKDKFNLALADMPKQFDVVFLGLDGDGLGDVIALAGSVGQRAIAKLFPANAHIAWHEIDAADWPAALPADWREFCFIVPSILGLPDHGLRLDLLTISNKGVTDLSAHQFAFWMMYSTDTADHGVRAAVYSTDTGFMSVSDAKHFN